MIWELQGRPVTGRSQALLYQSVGGQALCSWGWQVGLLGMREPAGLQMLGVEYELHI